MNKNFFLFSNGRIKLLVLPLFILFLSLYFVSSADISGDTSTSVIDWIWNSLTKVWDKIVDGVTADSVPDIKVSIADRQEKAFYGKKYSNTSNIILSSPITYWASWFPDNHPLNKSKNLTFEIQLEDTETGKIIALKGSAIVPKYYSGRFDFDSSIPGLINFTNLKTPTINWKYSTDYDVVKKEIKNTTLKIIYENVSEPKEVIDESSCLRINILENVSKEVIDEKTCGTKIIFDGETTTEVIDEATCKTKIVIEQISKEIIDNSTCKNMTVYENVSKEKFIDNDEVLGIIEEKEFKNFQNIKTDLRTFISSNVRLTSKLDPDITECGLLDTANAIYTLTQNVTSNSTCFNITANNVTLDGAGYTINYSANGTLGYGVYVKGFNFSTIKNAKIVEGSSTTDAKYAIYYYRSNNATVQNNAINTSGTEGYGIYFSGQGGYSNSNKVYLNNISTRGVSGYGIFSYSNYDNITSNYVSTFQTNGYGIYLSTSASNNIIQSNNIKLGGAGGSNNHGVYIYSSSNNNQLLYNNITTSGTSGYGVYIYSSSNNNSVAGNNITTGGSSGAGIRTESSHYNSLISNKIITTGATAIGIHLITNSRLNNISLNIINTSSTGEGIRIYDEPSSNNFTFNNITTSGANGLRFDSATNNTFTNNNFTTLGYKPIDVTGASVNRHFNNSIDSSNLADGKPVWYNYSKSDLVFDKVDFTQYGQVIFANCTGINISNSNFTNGGLNLWMTNKSNISTNYIVTNKSYDYGLYLYQGSSNNVLENNDVNTSGSSGYGMYLLTGANGNNLTRNEVNTIGTSSTGVYLSLSLYNLVNYSFINSSYYGIFLSSTNYSSLTSNIIQTLGTDADGIYLYAKSNNNLIQLNNITSSGSGAYGVRFDDAYNNNFTHNNVTSINSPGIALLGYSSNNSFSNMFVFSGSHQFYNYLEKNNFTISDSILNSSGSNYDLYISNRMISGTWNFTNVTRADGSPINISWSAGGNGTLNMHWYADYNVSYGGLPLNGAVVNSTDLFGNLWNSSSTNSTGGTRHILKEFTQIAGTPTQISNTSRGLVALYHLNNESAYGENSTRVYDFSGNGNNGTASGGVVFNSTSGKIDSGTYFSGLNTSCLNITNNRLNFSVNSMSFTSWFKTVSSDYDMKMLYDTTANSEGYSSAIFNSKYETQICTITNGCVLTRTSSGTKANLNDGLWHFAVTIYNGSAIISYVDGSEYGNYTLQNGTVTNGSLISIGCFRASSSPKYPFNGSIDEVAIYNRSLSADEVRQLYIEGYGTGKYSNTPYKINVTKTDLGVTGNNSANFSKNIFMNFAIPDTIIPVCTLINRTPSDINDSSTGVLSVIMNCSDSSGINLTKISDHNSFFITRTVDANILANGIPNYWSNRFPNNSLGVTGTLTPPYTIWRALGRNEGYWYENITTDGNLTNCQGISPCFKPLNDTFSYAIEDGDYGHFTVTPENASANTSVIINYTHPAVDISAFRQSVYLSYESMVHEGKKNFTIDKTDWVLMKRFDAEAYRDTANYTMNSFRNFVMLDSPTKVLSIFYCNESIENSTGGISGSIIPTTNSNCGLISSLTSTEINNIIFTDANSSYSKGTYAITNGYFSGIKATKEFYISYQSLETAVGKGYNLRYVNGTTNTNIGFNDTKVVWTSANQGTSWLQQNWTPDVFTTSVRSANDEFQFGYFVKDIYGNQGYNFTFFKDEITLTNHGMSFPQILIYNSSNFQNDMNLNETHIGTMQIKIGCAIDPDSVGNVTHNLTLRNLDGSYNATINNSFVCPNDQDLWITFDTSLITSGNYRMNITAYSPDNELDVKSRTTDNNFTIQETAPLITIHSPINASINSEHVLLLNISTDKPSLSVCNYSKDNAGNVSFLLPYIELPFSPGNHSLKINCRINPAIIGFNASYFEILSQYTYINQTINNYTGSLGGGITKCKYKKFGYYNLSLPWFREVNCV